MGCFLNWWSFASGLMQVGFMQDKMCAIILPVIV